MLIRVSHQQSTCEFEWFTPEINQDDRQLLVTFIPNDADGVEDNYSAFWLKYDKTATIPEITVTDSILQSVVPDMRTNPSASKSSYITVTDDGSSWWLKVSDLTPLGITIIDYKFTFVLTAPPFQHEWDASAIECSFRDSSDNVVYSASGTSSITIVNYPEVILPSSGLNSLTVSSDSTETGSSATLTISYTTKFTFLNNSWLFLTIPKSNRVYSSNASSAATSFVSTTTKGDATVTIGGTSFSVNTSSADFQQISGYNADTWIFTFTTANSFTSGTQSIVINMPITNPMMVNTLSSDWALVIKTELGTYTPGCSPCSTPDTYATYETSSGVSGGIAVSTILQTSTSTSALISNGDSLGATDATYTFEVTTTNDIPTEGVMILTVPSGVTVPSSSTSGFSMSCSAGCDTSGTMTYSSSNREFKITGAFGSYLTGGNSLLFSVTGWTNPSDTSTQTFSLATYYLDSSNALQGIENFTGLELGAADGSCYVQYANVTDSDTRIYATPLGYSFQMWCSHEISTSMGLQIIFPSDYIVMDRSSCFFFIEGISYSRYYCQTYASTNTIQVTQFLSSAIAAETVINFTIDSVINPGTYGATGEITLNTIDSTSTVVDQGTYTFDAGYYTSGTITKFTITPQLSAVSEDKVKYDFNIQPNGEIPRYGYLQIELPDEVTITNERYFEDSCGENIEAFTNTVISCVVMNSKRIIQVKDGFLYQASTNFTDTDGLYFPPDLYFTLEGFKNPKSTGYTSPWNVTIYSESDRALYYWQSTNSPTIRFSGISAPAYIQPSYENQQNGAFTWIEFLVTTTGGLTEGDKILIKLPSGWQFSTDSRVKGISNNMADNMESALSSSNQRLIEFNVELDPAVQRRRQLQAKLEPGFSFRFQISEMKNFYSLRPSTESIEYYVYTSAGELFEEKTNEMFITNKKVGLLDAKKNGILPTDFRTEFPSPYLLTLQVANFETNMVFTLFLPEQINFQVEEDPQCFGISGTDNEVLRCDTNRGAKSLSFTNVLQYRQSNPGQMKIQIDNLMNPSDNVITSSFGLTTNTADGYGMDELYEGITINFYCEYPCAECPQGFPEQCLSCYQTSVERFFHESQCLSECPEKMVETADNTCTDCISPCVTCKGTPNSCLTCIEGWYIVNGDECREEIFWYFPFVGSAFLFFIIISISECATKRASNFKESLIAFWSLPEVGSWGCLIYLMYEKVGQTATLYIAGLAALIYICINLVHAIVLPRYMLPSSQESYKNLSRDYPCGTCFARFLSYVLSFKFSLILVSNFCGSKRLKGDYSAANWKQFNWFSVFFIIFPYSCMMSSCAIFIVTDGFWSYAGFVAAEVICLSSIMTILLFIDAVSAIKCKTVGKRNQLLKEVNVGTAADYESDEDERNLKRQVRDAHRIKEEDVFGAGEDEYDVEDDSMMDLKKSRYNTRGRQDSQQSYRSQLSQQTQIMNDEARKQIQMLEELAHQMREEKRQLQLDKERIDREKILLDQDRVRSQQNIEGYMEEYQRQALVLNNQVAEMEKQKINLVQQVENRLEEGNRANLILAMKVQEAADKKKDVKNFRDFEGEMEDYEPVEEAKSSDEEEPEVIDAAQLPLPAQGQIEYVRQVEENQRWMQQITPRAGGVSMLGDDQHMDKEGDVELAMEKNATAHFETTSVPPSKYDEAMGQGPHFAEYQELTSQIEAAHSEEYHQRSDAEMEMNSEIAIKLDGHGQQYFEPERAIYSQIGDQVEKDTQAEFFTALEDAVYEQMEKPPTRHGNEQRYFAPIGPKAGDGDHQSDKHGSEQNYFKPEPPTYGIDDEGDLELQATDQHFFNPEKAQLGEADDKQRQGIATPQEYISRTKHLYGDDVSNVPSRQDAAETLFNAENAIKDDASNIGRSARGSELIYQEREGAYLPQDKEWHEQRQRLGSMEQFMERDSALYSQGAVPSDKNATETQFFKHEEAIRGDVSSQDRSVDGTQMDYFNNVSQASIGRPDTYERRKSAIGSEYMNRSDLGNAVASGQGLATPHAMKQAVPIEYMNKSEAEYGRPDSIHERDATTSKYFEQEQNPQFGRGDEFSRQAEMEKEYEPTPESDSSGRSESSEGGIANHQPFTSAVVIPKTSNSLKASPSLQSTTKMIQPNAKVAADPSLEKVKRVLQGNPSSKKQFEEDQQKDSQKNLPDAAAAIMPSPVKSRTNNQLLSSGKAPFNFTQPLQDQNKKQQQQMDPTTPQMIQPNGFMPEMLNPSQAATRNNQAKTILYSDKSETSVEDLMDDTPSNYNLANGRFEGKSLGLKAMLLHAKKYQNQTLEPIADLSSNSNLASQPVLTTANMAGISAAVEPQQNRSPQHLRPGQMLAPGMVGAQKGIIGSQNDERQFVNNLYQSQQSVGDQSSLHQWRATGPLNGSAARTLDVENSVDGDTSQMRNTRNLVRTNKQFTEDPSRSQASGVSPHADMRETKGRGAPKVTKNNYFGVGGSIN